MNSLETFAVSENFEHSCSLLKSTSTNTRGGNGSVYANGGGNDSQGTLSGEGEKKRQDLSATFLMTAAEQEAIDFLLLKDAKWSALVRSLTRLL